jgi:hypothetical protein
MLFFSSTMTALESRKKFLEASTFWNANLWKIGDHALRRWFVAAMLRELAVRFEQLISLRLSDVSGQ